LDKKHDQDRAVFDQKGARCGDIIIHDDDLEPINTDTDGEIFEVLSQKEINTFKTKLPVPRRMSLSQHTKNPPIIYDYTWRKTGTVTMRRPVANIIIADSNFRHANNCPSNWEVHVFPGLNLEQTWKLLQRSKLNQRTSLSTIIVSVGINNRKCGQTTNNVELGKLKTQLENTGKTYYFNLVSIPDTLPTQQSENLLKLNYDAQRKFGEFAIAPITNPTVMPMDEHKIHYDTETIELVCEKIIHKVFRETTSRKTFVQY